MFGRVVRTFATMNGRMFKRTPRLRSGFQPIDCFSTAFQRREISMTGLTLSLIRYPLYSFFFFFEDAEGFAGEQKFMTLRMFPFSLPNPAIFLWLRWLPYSVLSRLKGSKRTLDFSSSTEIK